MTAFERALRTHFIASREHPQYEVWLNYALHSNERGAELTDKLRHWVPSYDGLRTLDIGSGYGGTSIAMAQAGALAVGFEVNPTLLRLSHANAAGFPQLDVRLIEADAMKWNTLEPLGHFDVITCDNVIEHVPVPQVLLSHMRRLLTASGVAWLTAPNAFSFGQITKECHYGRFGLSLLDPIDGSMYMREALGDPSYDVSSYFTFDGYIALFERYGLLSKLLNPVRAASDEADEVRQQIGAIRVAAVTADVPPSLKGKVQRFLDEHLVRCEADLAFFDGLPAGLERELFGHRLYREYCTELWYFVLSPDAARLEG
jgi:2-polyprenyl-3-methyl-5-hydroxy-6-metoxy-1,4-benzoquinol methylase